MLSEILQACRAKRPLVHCITNYVTANDCANLLLAAGASPIMADDPHEAAEITRMCQGLVINMGTPDARKAEAMLCAGREANRLGHPVVLDPVGVGGSDFRRGIAAELLKNVQFSIIRGNVSEIQALTNGTVTHRGVDADECQLSADAAPYASRLARQTGALVIVTGSKDILTDGDMLCEAYNGHAMLHSVSGTGCQLSALLGAYAAANPPDIRTAALAAVCAMGLCGEIAHARLSAQDGSLTYRNYIIDALYRLTPEALEKGARYAIHK